MFLNITTEAFMEKPQSYSNLKFIQVETSIEGMAELIKKGHGFTSLYSVKNLVTKTKNKSNWKETWFLGYDIDHHKESMEEVYDKLTVKPSICYTTPSNKDNDYCFRLIYVLNKPINNIDEFNNTYISFSYFLGIDEIIDNHAKDCTRLFNGSYNCKQIINKEQVIDLSKYNLKDLSEIPIPNNRKEKSMHYYVDLEKQIPNIKCDETIKKDWFRLDYPEFYKKYMNKFVNRDRTYIEHTEDDPIIYIPKDDYLQVERTFYLDEKKKFHLVIWKDGQHREYKIYNNMVIRRFITPTLTIEDILYDIAYEITHFFDNKDGGLSKSRMFRTAIDAMSVDLNKPNKLKDDYKCSKTFYVNKEYCIKYNVSVKQVRNEYIGKSRSKDPLVEAFYENGLTAIEVYNIIVDNGNEISKSKVYDWFNKHVPKVSDDMIYDMIDANLSIEENKKILRDRGLKFDNNKFNKMVNQKKKNVFESDEEYFSMMKDMRAKYNAISCVPEPSEPLSSVDPTTIKDEEKEEPIEENNEVKMKLYQLFEETIYKDIEEVVETFDRTFDYSLLSDKELGMELTEIAFDNIGYNDYPRYTKICDNIETVFGMQKPKSINIKKDVKEDNMVRIGKYQVIKKEIYDMLEEPVDALPF